MRYTLPVVVLCVFSAVFGSVVDDDGTLYLDVSRSVFKIQTQFNMNSGSPSFGAGTAFIVCVNGRVGLVTAWHVVDDSPIVAVIGNGDGMLANFRRVDSFDLAWADADDFPKSWVPLHFGEIPFGGKCVNIGYSRGKNICMVMGDVVNVQLPIASSFYDGIYIRIIADIFPGMSGGPVLNGDNDVFAVVAVALGDDSFAVDASVISDWLVSN